MSVSNRKIQEQLVEQVLHSLRTSSGWEVDQEHACWAHRRKGKKSIFIAIPGSFYNGSVKVTKSGKKDRKIMLDYDLGKLLAAEMKRMRDEGVYQESLKVLKEVSTQE